MTSLQADPGAVAVSTVKPWLAEAAALREITLPSLGAGPEEFARLLVAANGRQSRVEELLRQARLYRGKVSRSAKTAQEAAGDAWDRVADADKRTARGSRDYEGARERYAAYDLKTLEQRRHARALDRAAAVASDAVEFLDLAYWGLNAARQDLVAVLRYFSLESNLER